MKKILVMGLPGTGKTTFAEQLTKLLKQKNYTVVWYNADNIREKYNDWDFSKKGRIRQASRMKELADNMMTDYVICDFVAPTQDIRNIFDADHTVWMNTENSSKFKDTDSIFENPNLNKITDYIVRKKDAQNTVKTFFKILKS